MYICVCNALNERAVGEAKAAGAIRVSQVFAYFGVAPQCGRCFEAMQAILSPVDGEPAEKSDGGPLCRVAGRRVG